MTRPSLAGIEQRASVATEGPWFAVGPSNPGPWNDIAIVPLGEVGAVAYVQPDLDDAAFIAHTRTDLPALTAAVRDVLALHEPTGIVTCGARTDGAVLHRHSNEHTEERVMTCSNPEGHEGPHRDAVCCWSFHSFSDGVPGVGRDLRSCADCGRSWPCRTYTALAARLDLTDPEGDPT